ncbi:MAG: hypothetical protein BroJett013_07360 [Alphaproteobacteria bacterium]|nr:MAG: hypothetical protein BroJett013_07360 [Alphaproteobacteria bacterium]
MSDLFPDDPRAVTARREAAVRGINDAIDAEREEAAQGRRFFSARDPADLSRGVASASYRLSELGGTVAFRAFDLVNDATHAVTGWDPDPNENMRAYEDALARSMREHRTRLAPDPVRSSYAGEILYGLGEIGALAASGGPVAGLGPLLTGGGMGVATAHELIDEGVDEQTAWRAGGIEGVSMSALVAAPVALPSRAQTLWARVAQRAATGAGINSVLGIGYRGAMSEYLRSQGYDDQASRYDAFDTQSLIADVVLGAAFGGLFGRRGAPRQRGGADAEDAAPRLSAEEHLDRAVEAYEGGDLVTARAHALMADRLGEQEGAFLAEEWGREGGQELVEDSQARSLLMAVEEGLIKPDEAMRDAAMLVQAERRANVDEAPGVALNLEGEALHARNMDAFDRAAAQGDEFPQAEWSAAEAENFAPHLPRDTSEAEAVVREVLEAEGYPELAREIEALRARIRDMGGEIGPDEMMFSFGPPRAARGVDPWRGNEPFHDERLTATQNKIVEMARNNYSNAEIADEMDTSVNTIAATLSKVRAKAPDIAGLTAGRTGAPRGQHDGRATAAIEDIVRLYNKLSRQGYRNWPGRPGFGRENLNAVIGQRLGLQPDNVAKRLANYRRDLAAGRIEGEPLYSMGRPVFVSAVERAVESSRTTRAPGAQWWATISKTPGVKKEELEWIGLEDFLNAQDGPVSRDDVLAFVRANGVRVEETVLGETAADPDLQRQILPLIEERDRLENELSAYQQMGVLTDEQRARTDEIHVRLRELQGPIFELGGAITRAQHGGSATRWSQYTLPGGENYREVLLRLPNNIVVEQPRSADPLEQVPFVTRNQTAQDFRSSHFDQPNILAHVRFNERVDAEGRRTLFIEEVQSDWHQAGRERGYDIPTNVRILPWSEAIAYVAEHFPDQQWTRSGQQSEGFAAIDVDTGKSVLSVWGQNLPTRAEAERAVRAQSVPDAPFKNNAWAALSMKRMIRWAAENGFDQIAWTRGQHQIERFNLGREINRIYFNPETREFTALARGGGAHQESNVTDARLAELIGKEGAKQVLEAPRNRDGEHEIAASDITIGGEGMRAFYDKILPNIANDLGKKFGARTGETQIDATPPDERTSQRTATGYEPVTITHPQRTETVHSLPITPEMREAVMEGQALFARGGEPSALRPADLVAQAERIFGADWKALAAAGHVEIVQSSREVPSAFGLPRGVQAVHMRDTGKTYFIANNIRDPAHMKGLILHEIGVHHGMPDLLGERGFREVLRQIETMVRAEHPEVSEARAWVESKYPNRADWSEETLAVLIETNADLPLVNRVLSKIRQWLIKTFGTTFGMRLTVDDLRALAVTSLRRAAKLAAHTRAQADTYAAMARRYTPSGWTAYRTSPMHIEIVRNGSEAAVPFSRHRPIAVAANATEATSVPDGGALPTAGSDFPLFSFGRQNGSDLLGVKRDPIESPDYQQRVRDLRSGLEAQAGARRDGQEPRSVGRLSEEVGAGGRPARDHAGGRRGQRDPVTEILAVSGVKLSTKQGGSVFGAYRAEIDTPFASEADAALQSQGGEGGPTRIEFDLVDGADPQDTRLPGLHIAFSRVNDAAKGRGVGTWFYRQLIEWADRRGLPVYSDSTSVSVDAQKVYRKLETMGYVVERVSARTHVDPEDGAIVSFDGAPVFRISKRSEIDVALEGAPLPRDDYQIDGPSLRERQQRIEDQRKRMEEYSHLDPVEQALRDEPDMHFSYGRRPVLRRKLERMNLPHPFVGAVDVIRNPNKADIEAMLSEQRRRDVQSVRWGVDQDGQLIIWDGTQATHAMVGESVGGRFVRDGVIEHALEVDAVLSTAAGVREGRIGGYDPASVAQELGISMETARRMLERDGKLAAREAVAIVREGEQTAREMEKGFDAAARCAIRHGGSLGTSAILVGRGVGSGTAIGTGHVLGMVAGIPGGWAASHLLARDADPRGYAEMRARMAGMRGADAARRAGEAAGLDAPSNYEAGAYRVEMGWGGVPHDPDIDAPVPEPAPPMQAPPMGPTDLYDPPEPHPGVARGLEPPSAADQPQISESDTAALIEAFRPLMEGEE